MLRMFNPDGTEDFCGNGLRCAAVHATGQGWVGERFVIHHHGSDVPTTVCGEGCIETQLGSASYKPEDIPSSFHENPQQTFVENPFGTGLIWTPAPLSTGSTHTIVWVDNLPGDEEFFQLGPRIENDAQFPERTSIIWAHETAPMKLEIRIWGARRRAKRLAAGRGQRGGGRLSSTARPRRLGGCGQQRRIGPESRQRRGNAPFDGKGNRERNCSRRISHG